MSQKHPHLWFNKFLLLCGILLLLAGGVIGYYAGKKPTSSNPLLPKQTACTMEAKICPDGSSVGRTGPNCEFSACPTNRVSKNYDTLTIPTPITKQIGDRISYTDAFKKFSFEYPKNYNYVVFYDSPIVVFFDNEKDYLACKEFEAQKKKSLSSPCLSHKFSINGYYKYTKDEYDNFIEDLKYTGHIIAPIKHIDSFGRVWQTIVELGQGYNYMAVYTNNNIDYVISFQAGSEFSSNEQVRSFFNQFLSTFEFLN